MKTYSNQIIKVDDYTDLPSFAESHVIYFIINDVKYYIYRNSVWEEIYVNLSSGFVSGTGASNKITLWEDIDTITYDNRISYSTAYSDPTITLTGTDNIISLGGYSSGIQTQGYSQWTQKSYSNSMYPILNLSRVRGTFSASTSPLSGDILGEYRFSGANTATVGIYAAATENHASGTNAGTKMYITTTPNGSINQANRFNISSDGYITFNQAYTFPIADGLPNQVLMTNGAGILSWTTSSGGGGTIDGSGATRRVALWSDADTLTYSNLIEGYESGGIGRLVVNSSETYQAIYGGYWDTISEGSSQSQMQLHTIGSSWSSVLSLRRSRGIKSSQTNVLTNDVLGNISFVDLGYTCAEISAIATEDHTTVVGGTKINFTIAKTGTGIPFDVLILDGDGRLKISDAYKLPLSDGSNGQVLSTDGAGSVAWVDNTGGPASQSNQILAMTELTSTALTTYTIQTGANFQAINLNSDGTNRYAKISFVAPTSGHVSVEMTFDMTIINSAAVQMIGLHTSSTATNTPAKGWYRINSDDDSSSGQYYANFRLTGLTPGTTYTYYFMAVCDFTGNTIRTSTQQSGAYSIAADLPAPLRITAYDLGSISVVSNPSS